MVRSSAAFRSNWLETRLRLNHHHPVIKKLEDVVWEFCVGFITNPARGKRLLLYGNNGTGKTRVSRAICRWVDERSHNMPLMETNDGQRVVESAFSFWPETVDLWKDRKDWNIDYLIDADLLVIDDIGAEHDPSKIGTEKLFRILERREKKWTIVTTNVIPTAWEERFERRVADRLFRNFTHVDLTQVPSYSINT